MKGTQKEKDKCFKMEGNFTLGPDFDTDINDNVNTSTTDVRTLAASYMMYKIGKWILFLCMYLELISEMNRKLKNISLDRTKETPVHLKEKNSEVDKAFVSFI